MKYAIISDLHANLEALTVVLDAIDAIGVDKTVCLGDVVGYNASPNECADIVRARNIPTVCGNHDAVACGIEEPWGFNPIALSAALWTRENVSPENFDWLAHLPDKLELADFAAVHGSPNDRDAYLFTLEDVIPHFTFLDDRDYSLCFFGHTHTPGIFSLERIHMLDADSKFALQPGKNYFINPGSVGQPRDGDPRAAFGVLDSDKNEFELVRVEYPVKEAADRILSAELPYFLAERLFLGR